MRAVLPFVAALLLALVAVSPALGHAELDTSDPADGAMLPVSPPVVTLTFTEGMDAGKSSFVLAGPAGDVGEATPAADGSKTMTLDGLALPPGEYTIRWTAAAEDGHIERGTLAFTVLEPTPPPATPSASPSASATAASPTPLPSLVATPLPSPGGDSTAPVAASGDVLVPIVATLAVVGVIAVMVLRRSRAA